jgi:hypothetical protein
MRGKQPLIAGTAGVTALGCAALVVGGVVTPANAATSRTFYASSTKTGNLVKVKLVGSKIVSHSNVAKTSGPQLFPQSSSHGNVAGLSTLFNSATSTSVDRVFTYHNKLRTITPKAQDATAAVLYNKGRRVAYAVSITKNNKVGYSIRTQPVAGGKVTTLYKAPAGLAINSLTTKNGKTFYFGGRTGFDAKVYKFVKGHSNAKGITKSFSEYTISTLGISPNGGTLAFGLASSLGPQKKTIRLKKIGSGGVSKSIVHQGFPQQLTWATNGKIYFDDSVANGWFVATVSTGKSKALNFNSTGKYSHPVAK